MDDAKTILGLETTDYPTFSKPDKQDEWSKHFDNLLQNFIGNKFHEYIKTEFIPMDGVTIALITVKPSREPVWLKKDGNDEFYIRRTASAIALAPKEATEYIQEHWKK